MDGMEVVEECIEDSEFMCLMQRGNDLQGDKGRRNGSLQTQEIKIEKYFIDDDSNYSDIERQVERIVSITNTFENVEIKAEQYYIEEDLNICESEKYGWNENSTIDLSKKVPEAEQIDEGLRLFTNIACDFSGDELPFRTANYSGRKIKCKKNTYNQKDSCIVSSYKTCRLNGHTNSIDGIKPVQLECRDCPVKNLGKSNTRIGKSNASISKSNTSISKSNTSIGKSNTSISKSNTSIYSCLKCNVEITGSVSLQLKDLKCIKCYPILMLGTVLTSISKINLLEYKNKEFSSDIQHLKSNSASEYLKGNFPFAIKKPCSYKCAIKKPCSYKCADCLKSFYEKRLLKTHIKTVHCEIKAFQCTQCCSAFGVKTSLQIHIKFQHPQKLLFQCRICDLYFTSENLFDKHFITVHRELIPFKCAKHKSGFAKNPFFALKRVKTTPYSDCRPFKCKECILSFKKDLNLKSHIRTVHEKQRPHKCKMCSKCFISKRDLKRHTDSVHYNFKSFECPYCSLFLSDISALARHIKNIHLKIKPYKCLRCNEGFVYQNYLDRHYNSTHHNLKPY